MNNHQINEEIICKICFKPFKQEDKKDLAHEGIVKIKLKDEKEIVRRWRYNPEDRVNECKTCCEMGNSVAAFTAEASYLQNKIDAVRDERKAIEKKAYYNKFKNNKEDYRG